MKTKNEKLEEQIGLHFSDLSERAQELIVDAAMGAIEVPIKMSDSVKEEIRDWAFGPDCNPKNDNDNEN